MIETAHELIYEGFGALPLNADKSPKLPVGHNYLYELIKEDDIDKLFIKAEKIGIACGEVSGNFEGMDFDGHDGEPIRKMFNDFMKDDGVKTIIEVHNLPIVKTMSGGYHIYYRTETPNPGMVHAKWESGKTMIETRGHGQYICTFPSKGYELIAGSEIIKTSKISDDERDYFISVAESLSEKKFTQTANKSSRAWPTSYDTSTVWGRYSETEVDEFKDLIIQAGWRFNRTRKHDGVELWTRPGKEWKQSQPVSATFGKYHNMFYVYSSNAEPFEAWTSYSLFDVFILLKHKGDKQSAIRELEQRYDITHYKPVVRKNTVDFPISVFPENIQNYLVEQNTISNFDINLMSSAFIWLSSTIIGNRFTTFVNDNWNVSPVTWLMIIAERGSTKTHAINAIIKPAKEIDTENRKAFELALKNYNPDDKSAVKPHWKQIFLEDGTREGFVKAMSINPSGLGLLKDELNGWIADMDKHSGSKGGDEAFWLSSFNNSSYTKNIKGDEGSHVGRMFINLAGSIQPDIINDLARNHTTNGLFDRFLLVPYKEKEFIFSMVKPEITYYGFYNSFIKYFISFVDKAAQQADSFYFEADSSSEFESLYNYFLQLKYKDDNPNVSSYIAKIITYIPRVVLIIEVINQAYNSFNSGVKTINPSITKDSVLKTKDVLNYFLNNARNVLFDIEEKRSISEVIKASGKVKKVDKAKVLIEAMLSNELNITQMDIARELSMSKQLVKYHTNKVKENLSKSIDKQGVK